MVKRVKVSNVYLRLLYSVSSFLLFSFSPLINLVLGMMTNAIPVVGVRYFKLSDKHKLSLSFL